MFLGVSVTGDTVSHVGIFGPSCELERASNLLTGSPTPPPFHV
jgi:hypothetical protein